MLSFLLFYWLPDFLLTTPFHFWWRLLALFLGLLGCGYVTSIIARNRREKSSYSNKPPNTGIAQQAGRAGIWLVIWVVGVILGYGIRDHELATNTVFYTEVYIPQKFTNNHFLIQPARMQPIDSTICEGSQVDWQDKETLRFIRYEQMRGCKRIIAYGR